MKKVLKISPDFERAKSILKMTELIEKRINIQPEDTFSALILADYYEVIKELITAIMFIDGYKTLSHVKLFAYLKKNYDNFSEFEVELMNQLRILRNKICYEGFLSQEGILEMNENDYKKIILKLKNIVKNKL